MTERSEEIGNAEPCSQERQRKKRLEEYPIEVLEAVLGILLAQKNVPGEDHGR